MKKTTMAPAIKRILCVLLLLISLVMTFRTAWKVSTTLIDSDTSSELILGEKLSREGGIMSDSWVYSTELQVVDEEYDRAIDAFIEAYRRNEEYLDREWRTGPLRHG